MRQFFLTVAGVFAGLSLFVVAVFAFLMVLSVSVQSSVERGGAVAVDSVLLVDLRSDLPDQGGGASFSGYRAPSLIGLIEALASAEEDDRVKGVFVRASEGALDAAHAEEIHKALVSLRAAGKFVVAHAQGFEDTSVTSYLAASAADEIWLQPTSNFVATGLAVETPFLGGVFEKYGVEPEFERFAEYKNAVDTYTRSDYTAAHAEAMGALLASIFDASVDISAKARRDRGMTPASLRSLIENSPYAAEQALELGLVDRLGHVVEAREAALERAGEDAELIDVFAYLRAAGDPYQSGPVIAVVAGQGTVVTGEMTPSYFGSSSGFFSDTIADAILDAAEDDAVKAIVLRIDSPGGSAIASDQVWDAVERAKEAGTPVIASFGSVAASGGYYVAAGADRIIAPANTITGSIGVYGGKFVLEDAFDRVGFNLEPLSVGGDFGLAYSSSRSFSPAQRAAFRGMLADVYEDFTSRVAEGRNLDSAAVQTVARGRVWSGADALERGLVDELGGYRDAIDAAKELAGLAPDENVTVRRYPEEFSPFALLQSFFGASAETARAVNELHALADQPEIRAAIDMRERAGQDMILVAPFIDIR